MKNPVAIFRDTAAATKQLRETLAGRKLHSYIYKYFYYTKIIGYQLIKKTHARNHQHHERCRHHKPNCCCRIQCHFSTLLSVFEGTDRSGKRGLQRIWLTQSCRTDSNRVGLLGCLEKHPLGVIIILPIQLIQFPLPCTIPDKKSGDNRQK